MGNDTIVESEWKTTIGISVNFMVGLTTVTLNAIIMKCIMRWKKLYKITRMLLIHLAAGHFLFGLAKLSQAIIALAMSDPRWMCATGSLISIASSQVSISAILLLSIDVFITTRKASYYTGQNNNRIQKLIPSIILACWISSWTISLIYIVFILSQNRPQVNNCMERHVSNKVTFVFACLTCIQCFICIIFYS